MPSETDMKTATILPILLNYSLGNLPGPHDWPLNLLHDDLSIPHEALVTTLEDLFYNQEPPWREKKNKSTIAKLLAGHIARWCEESRRVGGVPFGSEENGIAAAGMVRMVLEEPNLLKGQDRAQIERIREAVERVVF